MGNFGITGMGMYVPGKILTNEEIESWGIGSSAKWIEKNTGVKERRIASSDQKTSDLMKLAAEDAMKNAGLKPEELDLIITATLTPDFLLPQTSSLVRRKIGAANSICFDIQAGCAGFIYGLVTAVKLAEADPKISNILIVGGDVISRVINWSERKLCSVQGDGAGAFIIQKTEKNIAVKASFTYNDDMEIPEDMMIPAFYGRIPQDANILYSFNANVVYENFINLIPVVVNGVLGDLRWKVNEVDLFIFPQISKTLINKAMEVMGISENQAYMSLDKYGYTFNSCLPIALCDALNNGRLAKGNKIVLAGMGGGNYTSAVGLEWEIK